jgi:hypothetical protein
MLATNLEAHAIEVLIGLGFKATLFPAYGIDPDGKPHDMTQMVLGLV